MGGTLPTAAQSTAPIKIAYDATTNDLGAVWSADSRSVMIAKAVYPADKHYTTQLYEIPLDAPSQPRLITEIEGMVSTPVWSPDRRLVAYTKDRSVFVQDRAGNILQQIPGNYLTYWSPDGTRLLVASTQGFMIVSVDALSAVQLTTTEPTSDMLRAGIAWSPDGRQVVMTFADGLYVVDAQTGVQRNLTHSNGNESDAQWSPDGAWIVFASSASYDNLPAFPSDMLRGVPLYHIRPDGTGLARLTNSHRYDSCPAWSPDGSKIAFLRGYDPEDNTLFVLDLTSNTLSWLDRPDGKSSLCPQWSPDGQQVLLPALLFEWEQGVSLYVAPLTAFKSDIATATLINHVVSLTDNEPSSVGLSVRSSPGYDNALVDKLLDGALFQILGTEQTGNGETWLHILYQGDRKGWLQQGDLLYVARNLDPNFFCVDTRPLDLITALQAAVLKRDGEALARLITPAGMYLSVGGGKTVHLSYSEMQHFFDDHVVRNWGTNGYSPNPILNSLADEVAVAMLQDLTPPTVTIRCSDNQDALSGGRELNFLNIPNYKIINFYSVFRPGAPGYELDWGAWGVAISYRDGTPVILGLTSYHWTP